MKRASNKTLPALLLCLHLIPEAPQRAPRVALASFPLSAPARFWGFLTRARPRRRRRSAIKRPHCGHVERVHGIYRRAPRFFASERMFDRCECSFTPVAERRLQGKF